MNTLIMTDTEGQPEVQTNVDNAQRRRLCTYYESILQLIVRIRERSTAEQATPSFEVSSPMFAANPSSQNDDDLFRDAKNLRQRVLMLFDRALREAKDGGYNEVLVEDAGFAMAAFLDEAVNLSKWDQKDQWQTQPIAKELYQASKSGDEFYERLDRIKEGRTQHVLDVLEVYYLCLTIGFKGKYAIESENLRPIIKELYQKIEGSQAHRDTQLSIDKSGGRSTFGVIKSQAPPWYAYGTALILVAVVWIAARLFAG